MYVFELDRPWFNTPGLFQGFQIRSELEIAELRRTCQHVYIQVAEAARGRGGPQVDPHRHVEFEMLKRIRAPMQPPRHYQDQTSLEQEIELARAVYDQTRNLLTEQFAELKRGGSLDAAAARDSVIGLADSVIRNPDALMCFSQILHKDSYTAQHSMRSCVLALTVGRHLGLNREALQALGMGGLLHDVGKVRMPDELLHKTSAYTDEESRLMRKHVAWGMTILEHTAGIPAEVIEMARCHHERHDGSGYPAGLKGDEIGMYGRIAAIVNHYDTLTADRPDRPGLSPHAALKLLYTMRDRGFHGERVEQFIQALGIYPIGSLVELNTGDVGVVVAANRDHRLKPRVRLILRPNAQPNGDTRIVDLNADRAADGRLYEIDHILNPGTYGLKPSAYLPH